LGKKPAILNLQDQRQKANDKYRAHTGATTVARSTLTRRVSLPGTRFAETNLRVGWNFMHSFATGQSTGTAGSVAAGTSIKGGARTRVAPIAAHLTRHKISGRTRRIGATNDTASNGTGHATGHRCANGIARHGRIHKRGLGTRSLASYSAGRGRQSLTRGGGGGVGCVTSFSTACYRRGPSRHLRARFRSLTHGRGAAKKLGIGTHHATTSARNGSAVPKNGTQACIVRCGHGGSAAAAAAAVRRTIVAIDGTGRETDLSAGLSGGHAARGGTRLFRADETAL
jgi:hypothetical protein